MIFVLSNSPLAVQTILIMRSDFDFIVFQLYKELSIVSKQSIDLLIQVFERIELLFFVMV